MEKAPIREYGKTDVHVNTNSALFTDVSKDTVCWMSHFDYISKVAPGFDICAHTADCPVAAAENPSEKLYAILAEEKPNQKEQVRIKTESLRKYFPRNYSVQQMEREILKLLETRYRTRNRGER